MRSIPPPPPPPPPPPIFVFDRPVRHYVAGAERLSGRTGGGQGAGFGIALGASGGGHEMARHFEHPWSAGTSPRSVPVTCTTTLTTTNWSVTYATDATVSNGAEKLTVIFSTNAPNQYIYARALAPDAPLGEAKTLSGAEADIPLAGSDFWLSDLGFEFYHWPDQVRLKGQMHRSRPCFVLQSVNPHPAPGGYARVLTWVDKDSGQPLQAEAGAMRTSIC